MMKVLFVLTLAMSMGACSGLKEVGEKHRETRQSLRAEQLAEKKELGTKHKMEMTVVNAKYDSDIQQARITLKEIREKKSAEKREVGEKQMTEARDLKFRLKAERELLSAKNSLEVSEYGTRKHAELKFIVQELEDFLK
jgi:hypothetical protein